MTLDNYMYKYKILPFNLHTPLKICKKTQGKEKKAALRRDRASARNTAAQTAVSVTWMGEVPCCLQRHFGGFDFFYVYPA